MSRVQMYTSNVPINGRITGITTPSHWPRRDNPLAMRRLVYTVRTRPRLAKKMGYQWVVQPW